MRADRPAPQRTWRAFGAVEFLDAVLPVTLRGELARMDNVNNDPTLSATYLRVQLVATYRFRYP